VRLKVIADGAAATAIGASEERKQCKIGESGERNIDCAEKRQPYSLRHADSSHIDLFITFLLPKYRPLLYNIA
jgi:hypothetical protein